MAVKEKKINKSHEIRVLVAKHPKSSVKQIIAWLDRKGIKVPPQAVYAARAKLAGTTATIALSNGNGVHPSAHPSTYTIDAIVNVRVLGRQLGGMDKLKEIVDILAN